MMETRFFNNICIILDIRNWLLPDGTPVNSNVAVFLRVQLESVKILFSHFKEVFLRISSNISLDIMKREIHKYHNKLS